MKTYTHNWATFAVMRLHEYIGLHGHIWTLLVIRSASAACQKSSEISGGNAQEAADPVRAELAPPNRAADAFVGNPEFLRRLSHA